MDYKETLQLMQTEFPMRGNLPQREPEIQKRWETEQVYAKIQADDQRPVFILHDGPPYANGHIHIGHALNKSLKDFVSRYQALRGYRTPMIHGWDTHGLPIELQVVKELGVNRHEISPLEFRRRCREYALEVVEAQKQEFGRLGVWGDWENSYLTLEPSYEAKQIEIFGAMARAGHIYKGLKPVYWCLSCETALAEAEIEYGDKTSYSIYVHFPLISSDPRFTRETSFIIWTTTPWTLPANLGISVHPDFTYSLVRLEERDYIVASELLTQVAAACGWESYTVVQTFGGRSLENLRCQHPFMGTESLVMVGDHVTLEAGTGCVHTAPGHGLEDYHVGLKYNLPAFSPVTAQGTFTDEVGPYAGMKLEAANPKILEDLKASGHLLAVGRTEHQYPHCWRCHEPVIFRATEQWFASVDGFRQEALKAIDKVRWIPSWGRERIRNMVADRSDWCISRQRVWGVPIPIFYCTECGEALINDQTIEVVRALFAEKGSDAWFSLEANEILPAEIRCACGGAEFTKEQDIMDVWFDSGSSHTAVLETKPGLSFPADLYLEGSDQHRGWFQSSLLTAVAARGEAPYRAVLTHGYVVDGEGKKMSKSLGNVVAPQKIISEFGADILRLWVAASDYRVDIRISPAIVKQASEVYRRIRNTFRFLLGNLADYSPQSSTVAMEDLSDLDRWALHRLGELVKKVTRAYDEMEFHMVYHQVHNFCAVDMSSFYLDILKDRLYCDAPDSPERRGSQMVMAQVLKVLVKLMAPLTPHTADEVWAYLPEGLKDVESVFLSSWPENLTSPLTEAEVEDWRVVANLRREVARGLEQARNAKLIGSGLEAKVGLYLDRELLGVLERIGGGLDKLFIVSQVELFPVEQAPADATKPEEMKGLAMVIERASGEKCQRCWVYSTQLGVSSEHPELCPRCTDVVK